MDQAAYVLFPDCLMCVATFEQSKKYTTIMRQQLAGKEDLLKLTYGAADVAYRILS